MELGHSDAGCVDRDVPVRGTTLHCVEVGAGRPVVFLHGNPTSSYLWRAVLARLPGGRRHIAVDLIGMGASGKPDIDYTLADHIDYVTAFLDVLKLHDIIFVAHDWGVAICLDFLRRHPGRVAGVAVMEGHLRPLASWGDFDPGGRDIFQQLRTPGVGERLVLAENFFIETLLPAGMLGTLRPADLDVYRRPYPDPSSRRPLLQWAREIPIGGEPAHSAAILARAWDHLSSSPVPKLLIHAHPGAVVTADTVSLCRRTLPNLVVHGVGVGIHFLPEDCPGEIAAVLSRWMDTLPPTPHLRG